MSSRVTFDVDGIQFVKGKLTIMEIGFKNATEKGLLEALLIVEATAKQRVPHVTGRLRRSIRSGIVDIGRGYVEGAVGANTVYAAAVEFGIPGTRNHGKPYLSRAVSENRTKIQALIGNALKNTLRGFKT